MAYLVWSYKSELDYRGTEYPGIPCKDSRHYWYALPLTDADNNELRRLVASKLPSRGKVNLPGTDIWFSASADCWPPGCRQPQGPSELSAEQEANLSRWAMDCGWDEGRGDLNDDDGGSACQTSPSTLLCLGHSGGSSPPVSPPSKQRALREAILNCSKCAFASGGKCRQHEDYLGGYGDGRVVVVAVNPQAPLGDPAYSHIEASDWTCRAAFGDHVLREFASQTVSRVYPDWVYSHHKGRKWVGRAAQQLGVTLSEFADAFGVVDAFKYVTANEGELAAMKDVRKNCPAWLHQQLQAVRPRLLVVAGRSAIRAAQEVLGLDNKDRVRMADLHGTTDVVTVGGKQVPVVLTIGFSGQTIGTWDRLAPRTAAIRSLVKRHVRDIADANAGTVPTP